ncbi:MAG: hypothetical protein NVSMB4_04190 [Acidimicrobiales bacterium]
MSDYTGGWLEPGQVVVNTTGKPEPVLTLEQWDYLHARYGSVYRPPGTPESDAHLLARLALRRARRLAWDVSDRALRGIVWLMGHG